MPVDALPGTTGIVGHEDAASGTATEHTPAVHDHFPRARHQRLGIAGVNREAGAAGVLVDEENTLPIFAAIRGAENAALWLGTSQTSRGAGVNNVGIGWMNNHPSDASGLLQSHVTPGLSRVCRLITSVPHHVAIANRESLSRT